MADTQDVRKIDRPTSKRVKALTGLFPFLKPYKLWLAAAVIALLTTATASLIMPIAARRVIDGFASGSMQLLDQHFTFALILGTVLAVFTGLRFYLVTRLGERVVADVRKAVFARTINKSPAFFESIMTGEVVSRITTDTTLVQSVIGSSVSWFLRNILMGLGSIGLMIYTAPLLALSVLGVVPVVAIPMMLLGRRVRGLSRKNQDWIAESSGNASEALLSAQTIQAFTHEEQSRRDFDRLTEESYHTAKRRILTRSLMTGIVIMIVFTSIIMVLWSGATDVRNNAMSVGVLVQFVIYAAILAGSVAALSEIWGELQRAAGATERIVELLHLEDSVQDPANPLSLPLEGRAPVTFENVEFSYPTRPEEAALNGVSFKLEPGETVALVGPSGAGKSTVIQLLQRFYDPKGGAIKIGGVDLRDMRRDDFRQALSLVPQEPVIFAATARDNIRFGRQDATDAEVEAAARAAAAHEFVAELPNGYDTYVGERGVMLSGGQRQRIAIARAILRDAPILLLDEATSALDAESERAVQTAVEQMSKGRTTLVVAHRLATVKRADRILVFEAGKIVASGTHEDLVAQGGLYARLARLQFTADGVAAA